MASMCYVCLLVAFFLHRCAYLEDKICDSHPKYPDVSRCIYMYLYVLYIMYIYIYVCVCVSILLMCCLQELHLLVQ